MADADDLVIGALLAAIPAAPLAPDDAAIAAVHDALHGLRRPERYLSRGDLLLKHARAIKKERGKGKGKALAKHVVERLRRYHEDLSWDGPPDGLARSTAEFG
jgi:hypothetical protein